MQVHRARRALHGRPRDRLGRVVAEQLEYAPRAVRFSVDEDRAARLERRAAVVVRTFTLRAVDSVEERRYIDDLGAVLEEVPVDDRAFRQRRRCGGHGAHGMRHA